MRRADLNAVAPAFADGTRDFCGIVEWSMETIQRLDRKKGKKKKDKRNSEHLESY